LSDASRSKSSTEKAGVPNHDVHRSQLGTPPTSLHPLGVRNRNHPTVATTPTVTETVVRVSLFIESKVTEPCDSVVIRSNVPTWVVGRSPILGTMDVEGAWAVTAGRTGVYFLPAPKNSGLIPPDVQIKAILADGSEVFPILEPPAEPRDLVGFGFVFDPPLPDGAVVQMNDRGLHTVGSSDR